MSDIFLLVFKSTDHKALADTIFEHLQQKQPPKGLFSRLFGSSKKLDIKTALPTDLASYPPRISVTIYPPQEGWTLIAGDMIVSLIEDQRILENLSHHFGDAVAMIWYNDGNSGFWSLFKKGGLVRSVEMINGSIADQSGAPNETEQKLIADPFAIDEEDMLDLLESWGVSRKVALNETSSKDPVYIISES